MDNYYTNTTLKEFYQYYLIKHQHPNCQVLHFLGLTLTFMLLIWGIITLKWYYFAFMPLTIALVWVGHHWHEKMNIKNINFKHPLFSMASNLLMYWDIITLQIHDKIEAANQQLRKI